jgi:Zn-dependent M28 family amino/carboxypeptidase
LGDSESEIIFMKFVCIFLAIIFALSPIAAQKSVVKTKDENAPTSKTINAAQLLLDDQTLSADDMAGRGIGTAGGTKAREYIAARFKSAGVKSFSDSYFQPFEVMMKSGAKVNGANVLGYVEGTKLKDKYIVVTAHYDHLGTRNGEIYNGADDDASGVVALFAIAEYLKVNKPQHSIIFAAFDGEESGFLGSKKFIAAPPVAKESILLNINMDMVAHNDVNELYASGTYHYPTLKPTLEKLTKTAKVKLILGHDRPEQKSDDWTNQSDHFVFHQQKIPFVYFGVEDHKDYHKPTDDFANINQRFFVQAVETILEAVKMLDKNLK